MHLCVYVCMSDVLIMQCRTEITLLSLTYIQIHTCIAIRMYVRMYVRTY